MRAAKYSKCKKVVKPLDIIDIKLMLDSGRYKTKINMFDMILLEDTLSCEAIKLMQLPEGYSFHTKGVWNEAEKGRSNWVCSICGRATSIRTDWCTCGADMRESMRNVND